MDLAKWLFVFFIMSNMCWFLAYRHLHLDFLGLQKQLVDLYARLEKGHVCEQAFREKYDGLKELLDHKSDKLDSLENRITAATNILNGYADDELCE